MEIQSEKMDEQIQKNEEEIRKLQERNAALRKKQKEQEKKEHDKWLSLFDKALTAIYGSRYPKSLDPEKVAAACQDMKEVSDEYKDNTNNVYREPE